MNKIRENCYAWSIAFFILGIIIIPFIKTIEWRLGYYNPFTLVFSMIGMAFLIAGVIRDLRDIHFNHYILNKNIRGKMKHKKDVFKYKCICTWSKDEEYGFIPDVNCPAHGKDAKKLLKNAVPLEENLQEIKILEGK